MKQQLQQVRTFQAGFKVRQPSTPELLHPDRFLLRLRLLQEELDELTQGFVERNHTAILDALVDIDYVLKGCILECGYQYVYPEAWELVHENNMGKLLNGTVRDDGKLIKPEGWKGPDLRRALVDRYGFIENLK